MIIQIVSPLCCIYLFCYIQIENRKLFKVDFANRGEFGDCAGIFTIESAVYVNYKQEIRILGFFWWFSRYFGVYRRLTFYIAVELNKSL